MKLKPCPFCGSKGAFVYPYWDRCTHTVHCGKCLAKGPYASRQTETEAVKSWNKRSEQWISIKTKSQRAIHKGIKAASKAIQSSQNCNQRIKGMEDSQ